MGRSVKFKVFLQSVILGSAQNVALIYHWELW